MTNAQGGQQTREIGHADSDVPRGRRGEGQGDGGGLHRLGEGIEIEVSGTVQETWQTKKKGGLRVRGALRRGVRHATPDILARRATAGQQKTMQPVRQRDGATGRGGAGGDGLDPLARRVRQVNRAITGDESGQRGGGGVVP